MRNQQQNRIMNVVLVPSYLVVLLTLLIDDRNCMAFTFRPIWDNKGTVLRRTIIPSTSMIIRSTSPSSIRKTSRLYGSSDNNGFRHTNEFSRPVYPDRVLKTKPRSSNNYNTGSSSNDYNIDIEATAEECQALAERFGLPNIGQLQASITIRTFGQNNNNNNNRAAAPQDIEVEGTVAATVTQKCVRTNDNFVSTIEFPLYCIVRPATPILQNIGKVITAPIPEQQSNDDNNNKKGSNKKKDRKQNDVNYRISNYIDEMDIMQLQRMLQQDISSEDDVLMEDEFIYATGGAFDIGELVSQLFWLELDRYPKKPGTGPIQTSISG